MSLSSRFIGGSFQVALLAEGVDRNDKAIPIKIDDSGSPSSRRAWIEIGLRARSLAARDVALLAEGVDRNLTSPLLLGLTGSRPPRGGRG